MAKELSFRIGDKVRHVETIYNWWWGNKMETVNRVVTIVDRPRDPETGRYCRATDYNAHVTGKPERGDAYELNVEHIEAYNTIWDLTHEELMELRGQVCLGSLYLSDYDNNFGIDSEQVYTFCEGFGEKIGWNEEEDTPENFANYCEGVERYAA